MKQTFFSQMFGGFFAVFWVLVLLVLIAGAVSAAGYDIGLGNGTTLLLGAAGITLFIAGVIFFNVEQRAARGLPPFKWKQ